MKKEQIKSVNLLAPATGSNNPAQGAALERYGNIEMRQPRKIFICGFIFLLIGCSSIRETYVDTKTFETKTKINLHKKRDNLRRDQITQCSKSWVYRTLDKQTELKIIQYHKAFQFDLTSQPALIIGLTDNDDTIRVLINKYNENLTTNEIIKVKPDTTIDIDNELSMGLIQRDLPIFLSKKRADDKYFCDIKKTYFGTIEK